MPNGSDFYTAFNERLQHRWKTIDFYSISGCFGFYSQGMKVFSTVLNGMRRALLSPPAFRKPRVRLLVCSDDGPIDAFGVERFHEFLVPVGLALKRLETPLTDEQWVQFAIFNDEEMLFTHPQSSFPDEALALGINKLSPVSVATVDVNSEELSRKIELFRTAWDQSERFDFPKIPTIDQLKKVLTRAFPIERDEHFKEKDYERQLFALLHGLCDPQLIHRQFTLGTDRFDFVLGDPTFRLLAIEIKVATNDASELKRLRGQIDTYKKVVRDVLVIIIGHGVSAQNLGALERDYERVENVSFLHLR